MENNHQFYSNKACKYFPCHEDIPEDEFNCMFCYCPLYLIEKCGGTYTYLDINGNKIKDCSNCLTPHKPDAWHKIVPVLTARVYGKGEDK